MYKGTMPRMSRVVVDVAITFMIVGGIKDMLLQVFPDHWASGVRLFLIFNLIIFHVFLINSKF